MLQKWLSWSIFPDQSKTLGDVALHFVQLQPAAVTDLDNPEKSVFFQLIEAFRSQLTKIDIKFEFCRSKYTKLSFKKIILDVYNIFVVTVSNCMIFWIIYREFLG